MSKIRSKRRQSISRLDNDENIIKRSKKSLNVPEQDNLLHKCLREAGLMLCDGETANQLSVSKAVFQKKLCKILKNQRGDLLQNVETFLQELGEYLEEPKRFNQCLMPCAATSENDSSAAVPEAAIRLLLGVDVIQSPLMTMLLDKLLVYWGEEEDYIFHQKQMIYIPRLLLSQFRFLDRIVDGKELTSKLLTVLSSVSPEVQKEILACIPDVVEDSEHGEVARKLREELASDKDLACAIIDALTYLNISEEQVVQVRTAVLDMLRTFSINDLPIVINFLLESITAQDALEVVNEIRANVSFVVSSRLSTEELEKVNSSAKLTVDALKSRMQFQKYVAEAWIKALDTAQSPQTLDVFALLILHWLNHRKAVESLIRNKIRAGLLSEPALTKIFTAHTQIVRDYFPSILSLAQTLVRSPEPSVGLIGSALYRLAFTQFDSYCKQELVASLLNHVGSGVSLEIAAALDILAALVKTQLQEMTRFAVFIKGALDYLDHNSLSISHIKKLYLLLAELAFKSSQNGNYLQDDLHIIIRKQLTSGNSKYKRMGVMGAISIVQALAGNAQESTDKSLDKEQFKQVVDLLELMRSSCARDAEMTALFLDSLAATLATQRLSGNIETWIADNMTETFEGTFVCDVDELDDLQKNASLAMDRLFNLNNEAESTIFIKLVPLVEKHLDKTTGSHAEALSSPVCLAPLFRLITRCEMLQSKGDLENIDALLGCPILMIKPDVPEDISALSPKEKDVVCSSLFFCINWIREVVNSFGAMTDTEMTKKIIQRLRLITKLNHQLAICLAQHPRFIPPAAIFELETPNLVLKPSGSGKPGPGGKKKGGKGKKGKKTKATIDETISNSTQGEAEGDISVMTQTSQVTAHDSSIEKGGDALNTGVADLSNYRQFFREIDLSVFTILKVGVVRRWSPSAAASDTDKDEERLDLPELRFLLEDLSLKLKHTLVSNSASPFGRGRPGGFAATKGDDSRKAGFFNLDYQTPAEIVKKSQAFFPILCDFLEEACSFFQTQTQDDVDEEDLDSNPVVPEEDRNQMSECFHLLLQCVFSLLSWDGFKQAEHQEGLSDLLAVVDCRLRPKDKQLASLVPQQEKVRNTFQYFSNLVEPAPNLDCAVVVVKLLKSLSGMCTDTTMKEKLAGHAKSFLSREWLDSDGQPLKGAQHNERLESLLKVYVMSSPDPLETLENLVSQSLASMVKVDKKGSAKDLASLNRLTYPVFYKVVLSELISNVKRIPASKKSDSMENLEERLLSWTIAVKILYVAVNLTKVFNARSNLSCALRLGRQFVELFLRLGMPLMDITFRRRHTQVEKLLRSLQGSTRMLHHLCGHSKINKDVALTNQVPMLKRALESFVYRVKAMLALNNCQDAFWMGNLKNRNLQGEEILTQTSEGSPGSPASGGDDDDEDENDEENDDHAGENEDSEVELDENLDQEKAPDDSNTNTGSYSEIF